MKTRYLKWLAIGALMGACDSPLDTDPTASIDAGTALTTPRGIELALNGAYRSFQTTGLYNRQELAYPDLYADNLDFTGTFVTDQEYSTRNVQALNSATLATWADAYDGINRANGVIKGAPTVDAMTDEAKTRAAAEAKFIRALHYSILARWFGGVPIVTEPSAGVGDESLVSRATLQEVYAQIASDLESALPGLPTARTNGRATQAAANALLARIYLDDGKHTQARDKATLVIANTNYRLMTTFAEVFRNKNSAESIFELQYSINNTNAVAFWFFTTALGGRYGFGPSATLDASFPAGDTRKPVTIALSGGARYGNKYTRITTQDDNIIVLRVAEMYLIRAEANARLNADAATVRADLNALRTRAGAPLYGADVDTQSELLDAVLLERRIEMAMEGHRLFDLRRFGRAEAVLGVPATKMLMPIPQAERDVNKNLTQNPGY